MLQEFEDDSWNGIMILIVLTNINYTSATKLNKNDA